MKEKTDAEWEMQVRQVEALEKIADALETLASVVEPTYQTHRSDGTPWPATPAFLRVNSE